MAAVGGLFSETLNTITTTKLQELSHKRAAFDKQYHALEAAAATEEGVLNRLCILVDGVKACFHIQTRDTDDKRPDGQPRLGSVIEGKASSMPQLIADLTLVDRLLDQARFDPSVNEAKFLEWEQTMMRYLKMQSAKYEYADLYGRLVTEWLAAEQPTTNQDVSMKDADAFEEVPTAGKLESRKEWEQSVFEAAKVDENALGEYLRTLYGEDSAGEAVEASKDIFKALKSFRGAVATFESQLAEANRFNATSLVWTIKGLESSDLLSEDKRAVLKDFLGNSIILAEIADVLNMRLAALKNWSWGDAVSIEQRRMVSGGYSIHLHEDLLQAIFLQYLGVRWCVFFKHAFQTFRAAKGVWKPLGRIVSKLDNKRRGYYLGDEDYGNYGKSLNSKRVNLWKKYCFLYQLPDFESQLLEHGDGEEEAEIAAPAAKPSGRTKQTARASRSAQAHPVQVEMAYDIEAEIDYSDDEGPPKQKRPMEAKQALLHLLATEIAINIKIHGEITAFRSSFDQWNPRLPHKSLLTVLSFFGVSPKWMQFFQRFLEAPLRFVDEGNAAPRVRRRGTPGAHALSDLFGEVMLFNLDFAVNQKTGGGLLHRISEDFWFWSHDSNRATKAWAEVDRFTKVFGVQLYSPKTGSVRIGSDLKKTLPLAPTLPKGQIRWGMLYLDPRSGQFKIDATMIDGHTKELRSQLQSKDKSIFSWVQAYNAYATTFFTANFGKAANCFGQEHVNDILKTHWRVHRTLFAENGSVVGYLKRLIQERFDVEDVPDGFLFFPTELGGLNVTSPFADPLLVRDAFESNPSEMLHSFITNEKDAYADAKERFDKGSDHRHSKSNDSAWTPDEGADVFMSFAEYIKHREDVGFNFDPQLSDVFTTLLEGPSQPLITAKPSLAYAIAALSPQATLSKITRHWYAMDNYWKWVAQMYGPGMIETFGGLNVVDPGLLPVGMVNLLRGQKVRWQG